VLSLPAPWGGGAPPTTPGGAAGGGAFKTRDCILLSQWFKLITVLSFDACLRTSPLSAERRFKTLDIYGERCKNTGTMVAQSASSPPGCKPLSAQSPRVGVSLQSCSSMRRAVQSVVRGVSAVAHAGRVTYSSTARSAYHTLGAATSAPIISRSTQICQAVDGVSLASRNVIVRKQHKDVCRPLKTKKSAAKRIIRRRSGSCLATPAMVT
jgi:hypothetical protein